DRIKISVRIVELTYKPLISVAIVVDNSPPEAVIHAINSIERQLYPRWELLIALTSSASPLVRGRIQDLSARDRRVKILESDASITHTDALNKALRRANGEFILLTDDTGELSETALYCAIEEINRCRNADLIYADEDEIDLSGNRHQPNFKPDWNIDLFYSYNYL